MSCSSLCINLFSGFDNHSVAQKFANLDRNNSTRLNPDNRSFHYGNDNTAAEHTTSIDVTSVVPSSENVPSRPEWCVNEMR